MHITIEEAYRVLEVEHGSNEEIVKRQYKKLALKTHPDKNPDDPEAHKKFLLISEAYKRITDPDSFKDEDESGEPNEEEMEAMFNEMFAGLFGMQGFHGHGIPFELFQMFESMVDDDGDEYYYAGGGRGGPGGSYFDMSDEYDEEDGYDDEEGYADMMDSGGFLEAMLLNELLGGMGVGLGGGRGAGSLPSSSAGRKNVKGNEKKKQNKNKKKKGTSSNGESKKPSTSSSSQAKQAPSAKMSSSKGNKANDDGWETDDSEDEIEEEPQNHKRPSAAAEPKPISKHASSTESQQKSAKESKRNTAASSKKNPKFADHDSDDNEYADDSLMEMMMNHMAMELGLPNGEMLQFLIESEMLDGEDDDDDDYDYEDGKSGSSPSKASKKNKKKRDKQKKKKAAAAASAPPLPPAPTIPTKSRFGNINIPSSSSSSAVPSSSVHPHHQPTPTSYDEMPELIDASKEIEQLKQQHDPNFLKENGISNPSAASTSASEHTHKKSLESSNGIKLGDRVLITKRFDFSSCT
jgi:curved DNA-binding protein CbpA